MVDEEEDVGIYGCVVEWSKRGVRVRKAWVKRWMMWAITDAQIRKVDEMVDACVWMRAKKWMIM